MRGPLAWIIGFILISAASAGVVAQPYPGKPIRLVLSVGTGGVGDTSMRFGTIAVGSTQYLAAERLKSMAGIEARASTPAEATQLMAASVARWSGVIEQAKIPRQ